MSGENTNLGESVPEKKPDFRRIRVRETRVYNNACQTNILGESVSETREGGKKSPCHRNPVLA